MGGKTKAICGAVLALAVGVTPAAARPGPPGPGPSGGSDTLVTSGVCDAGSTWKLSGRSRYLRVDVEARVDTDRRRGRWVVRVVHNQTIVAMRSRKATGSGVVRVRARVRNESGPDTFALTARNRITSETCHGTLTF